MSATRQFSRRQFVAGSLGAVVFATLPVAGDRAAAVVDFWEVVSGPLNLRTGPGLGYSVKASLPVGTRMEIIDDGGTANGYTWVEVYVNSMDVTGFVASEFIAKVPYDGAAFPVGSTVVTTDSVNLRSGAGLGYSVIVTLWDGAPLTVTGAPVSANGYQWYPVRTGYGTTGWVAGAYLVAGTTPTPAFPVGSTARTTAALNIRTGAGLGYPVIVTLWVGAPVTITGAPVTAGGFTWYPIRTGYGTTGWVAGEYLTK